MTSAECAINMCCTELNYTLCREWAARPGVGGLSINPIVAAIQSLPHGHQGVAPKAQKHALTLCLSPLTVPRALSGIQDQAGGRGSLRGPASCVVASRALPPTCSQGHPDNLQLDPTRGKLEGRAGIQELAGEI